MYRLAYITCSSPDEARIIAQTLIEERLAACVNILAGVISLYRWEGAIQMDDECLLLAKTSQELEDKLIERVRALHSYDCPAITTYEVQNGNPDYLKWLGDHLC